MGIYSVTFFARCRLDMLSANSNTACFVLGHRLHVRGKKSWVCELNSSMKALPLAIFILFDKIN